MLQTESADRLVSPQAVVGRVMMGWPSSLRNMVLGGGIRALTPSFPVLGTDGRKRQVRTVLIVCGMGNTFLGRSLVGEAFVSPLPCSALKMVTKIYRPPVENVLGYKKLDSKDRQGVKRHGGQQD